MLDYVQIADAYCLFFCVVRDYRHGSPKSETSDIGATGLNPGVVMAGMTMNSQEE